MDEAEFSLTLGSNWLSQERRLDPEGYLEKAWRLYVAQPDPILESALLGELAGDVRLIAWELRTHSESARGLAAEDLLRTGLLALQRALSSLRHLPWPELRTAASQMAREAMQWRAER